MRPPDDVLVIGVGNPFRRDDGVGLVLLDQLRTLDIPGVTVVEEGGESTALVARWAGWSSVVMIDAVSSGAPPGTVHRLECGEGHWEVPQRSGQASTHGLGVAAAVELGRVLDSLPKRLVIFGIETEDVGNGEGLSRPVSAAIVPALRRVVEELTRIQEMSVGADEFAGNRRP